MSNKTTDRAGSQYTSRMSRSAVILCILKFLCITIFEYKILIITYYTGYKVPLSTEMVVLLAMFK